MKTVEVRHGCLAADVCGTLDHHTCGSADACNAVKASGHVCTFGTTQRVTFHHKEDVHAEIDAAMKQHDEFFEFSSTPAHQTRRAAHHAAVSTAALAGKNIHSAEAEAEAHDAGHRHHATNRQLHDSNPAIFGHA